MGIVEAPRTRRLARTRLRAGLVVLLAGVALGGCGFQLQGAGTLPAVIATTYLDTAKPYTEFYDSLSDALRARGAQVVSSRGEAGAVLRILEDTTGQRILSVSARNTPSEYEVFYAVTFSLETEGARLIDAESLVMTRSYTYDETEVLGKSAEEQMLRVSLAQDLARQVLRLLETRRAAVPATQG